MISCGVDEKSDNPIYSFINCELQFLHISSLFDVKEANDASDFFMTLEKDPQQEDFLQGRMLGNPYNSNEPGLGPLMRDVKNKICQGEFLFSPTTAVVFSAFMFILWVI